MAHTVEGPLCGATGHEKTQPMSHDQNFKNLILDYPHQAIAFFAAAEARAVDAGARIRPIREEQLQQNPGPLRTQTLDSAALHPDYGERCRWIAECLPESPHRRDGPANS
jgi:hypothetical protein